MTLLYMLTVESPQVAVCITEHNIKKLHVFHSG